MAALLVPAPAVPAAPPERQLSGYRGWYGFFSAVIIMKSRKDIFKDILSSAQTGCVVKLKLKDQRNPVITAVDRVSSKSILLKPTCLYGYPLEKRNITLLEIENIKRYKTYFDHPLFARLRYIKNNLSEVRKNFETLGSQRGETLTT